MKVKERPLREFLQAIQQRPITFSRWGDTEWHAVFGERNGYAPDVMTYLHRCYSEISAVLQSAPKYALGLPSSTLTTFGGRIEAYIDGCDLGSLDWISDQVFRPSGASEMQALLGLAARRPLIMIGPPRLHKLRSMLSLAEFIDVPPRHPYLVLDEIVRGTQAILEKQTNPAIVSVSAGLIAVLVVDRLYQKIGRRHSIIDFGSFWDPFIGAGLGHEQLVR